MQPRKPTVEAFVEVVKLLAHAAAPLSALDIVEQADVAEPSVRLYLRVLEEHGLIEPREKAERVEGKRGRSGQRWGWVR